MRLAILADIHGNLPALKAVLPQIERLQPDFVVLDGDLINGTPFSGEVVDLVRSLEWVVVRGNHEFYFLDFGTARAAPGTEDPERWGQLHWLVKHMRPDQGAYLAMLPDERTFYLPDTQPLRIAHGVPGHNRVGFSNRQSDAEIAPKIEHVEEPTLISAHTHVQIDRQVEFGQSGSSPRRWHLINPGSIGLPLNGDPRTQFALVESSSDSSIWGGWRATHFQVEYDRRPVLEAFGSSGMLEAGGIISQLFYWELCTAEPEIILFYRWCWQNGQEPDLDVRRAFEAYKLATGREEYARKRDPL